MCSPRRCSSRRVVTTAEGRRFVLKVTGDALPAGVVELERVAIERCRAEGLELRLPAFVATGP